MKAEFKLSRLVLVSPWLFLVFIVIPVSVIANHSLQIRTPLAQPQLLLLNNACFALLIACRLFHYLSGLRKPIRYGADYGEPERGETLPQSIDEARGTLAAAGYSFDAEGRYAEKRDLGYLGTTLFYLGIFLVLGVGTFDNMRHFSGALLDGIGPSTHLSKPESYRNLSKGPLATNPDELPQMQITGQTLPNDSYPLGATQVLFHTPGAEPQQVLLLPGQPFAWGDYNIFMARLIFEPNIVIKTDKEQTVFSDLVKLFPLVPRKDEFSFYGPFSQGNLTGDVYYQPEKSRLKVVLRRDGKRVMNTEIVFQGERQVGQADLILSCEKMGQWSEIRVVRKRHLPLVAAGAAIALIGLLLRLAVRAQRVWLEPAAEGCRLKSTDKQARRLLRG